MNKNLYRIIFSKARNMFIAVGENSKSQTKASGESTKTSTSAETQEHTALHQHWVVKSLVASISLWMPLAPVYAQIQADPSANAANRPVIGVGVNNQGQNVPVVNIQTPVNGVSHNIYKQMDVLNNGVVLNNSRTGAGSAIVGSVGANPFLAKGEARLILNEINSTAATRFEGNLEVAGQRADVIIANPAGINIKGGGFINANKAIFTTGKPQLNADGSLQQFVVDQGKVTVSANAGSNLGLGGNNNNADYVDIYARALELNAQLHANQDLNVITGANTISASLENIESKTSTAPAPALAVDIKSLGGMYANNIYLMGNEKGLGVSNAGILQATNNLIVTSAGQIVHSGTITSTDKKNGLVSVATTGTGAAADIAVSGTINSYGLINVDSGNDLKLTAKDIALNYDATSQNSAALIVNAKGNLNLASGTNISNLSTDGDLYIDAKNINLAANSQVLSNRGSATINAGESLISNNTANLIAAKDLNLTANKDLKLLGSALQASTGSINVQSTAADAQLIHVDGGTLYAGKDFNVYGTGDVSLKNLSFNLVDNATRLKDINVYSGKNLSWDNKAKPIPKISGKVQLEAKQGLELSGTAIDAANGIVTQSDTLNLNSAIKSDQGIDLTTHKAMNLAQGTALTATKDVNLASLQGNIQAQSLKVNSSQGRASIIANENINLNSVQATVAAPHADRDEEITDKTVIHADQGIVIASSEKGSVTVNSADLSSAKGDLQILGQSGVTLNSNTDAVVSGDNARDKLLTNQIKAKSVSIGTKTGNIDIKNTAMESTVDQLHLNSEAGMLTVNNGTLRSKGNTEIYAKDILTLKNVTANADQHLALNTQQSLYLITDYTPTATVWIPTGKTELTAKGVISLTTAGNQLIQNATLTGGAVLVEANHLDIKSGVILNAIGSDLLKNDAKLNSLNGDLSVQTTGTEGLTIDPKTMSLSAIGDIELVAKNGVLKLAGYGGTQGNGSEQIVKLNTSGGGVNLEGKSINIEGSQITASKDIKIVSSEENVVIEGVKNLLTNQLSLKEIDRLENESAQLQNKQIQTNESLLFKADKQALMDKINQIYSSQYKSKRFYTTDHNFPQKLRNQFDSQFKQEIFNFYNKYRANFTINLDIRRLPVSDNSGWRVHGLDIKLDLPYAEEIKENETEREFVKQPLNGYEHISSILTSSVGNINITSNKGTKITGSEITAINGLVNIEARAPLTQTYTTTTLGADGKAKTLNTSIIMDGLSDFYEKGKETDTNYSMRRLITPTVINGYKGVNIKAVGSTEGDNLVLQATGVISQNGNVTIQANKNILFDAAVETNYDRSTKTEKKKSWGGLKKKYITTKVENSESNAASVDIQAKNIYIESKEQNQNNSVDIYSGKFTADGGVISIRSGGKLNFYTVEESSNSQTDVTKKSSFAGIKTGSSKYSSTQDVLSELPTKLEADYIGAKSGYDMRLQGTEFEYLKEATLESGGKIELFPAITKITDITKLEKSSIVWQSIQDKGSITETAKLPQFNGPVSPTFKATGGISVQIPISEKDQNKAVLRDEILKLANQPGNAYLKELVNRNDVDWNTVILAQKDWDYKSEGLTGAGAAIIVIIVAVLTYGAGTALAGTTAATAGTSSTAIGVTTTATAAGSTTTFGGITLATTVGTGASAVTTYTAAGTMINTALTSLATQSSISLINNGGDISQTLKELGSKESIKNLATAVATAGVLSQLADVQLMKEINNLTKTGNLITDLTARTVQGVINAGATSLVDLTINGGSLSEKLSTALLANTANSLQGALSVQIKGIEDVDYLLHKIAHAAAGCVSAIVGKASCEAGAIGAAVGEIVAESMDETIENQDFKSDQEILDYQRKVKDVSKLVAGTVAGLTGYDVNTAANTAEIAISNNRQLRQTEILRIELLAKGDKAQQARLSIAACAMVKCAEGYEGTTEYSYLKAIQDAGLSDKFKAERSLLANQKFRVNTGSFVNINQQLFDYTLIDRKTDNALSIYNPIDRKYDIKDRSTGILMVAGGSTGMLGSATLGSTCLTGAGCVLALGGFVSSADLAAAGVKQTLNGKSYNTIGASVISATTGLSLNQSEFIYGLLGLASVTNAVRSQAKEAVNEGRVLVNKPVANCVNGTTCFVAGTLIETNQGLKPIESFIGGELIWSRSDNDFSYNYQPVVATKVTHNQPIYEIVVDNDLGIRESFLTTEEHPFWVKDVGWQQASVLKEGCILLDRNNNDLYVVSQTLLAKLDTVYNIEVDDYHTYHVGKFGVWVHNSNCCDLVYQNIAKETKYGVISNRKLDENALEMDLTSTTSKQAKQVAQSGDPLGVKTEALFENVVKEQGGKVLSGGKYGNNNGYDHVIVFKDAQGNTNLTMIVDSKQLGRKGIKLDPKAAGGNMQMSGEWDAAVLAKLDKNSEAYKAITAAQKNGTLVKGAAYVDKGTEKLMLVRIDPTTKK